MLLSLVSALVPISEDGKLIMWIPEDIHTYLYRPRNTSILNPSFFVKIHFGPNGILGRIYSLHHSIFLFIFPILSSILFNHSYSTIILLLFSKITFICDRNYSSVSIMFLVSGC